MNQIVLWPMDSDIENFIVSSSTSLSLGTNIQVALIRLYFDNENIITVSTLCFDCGFGFFCQLGIKPLIVRMYGARHLVDTLARQWHGAYGE